MVLKLPSYCQDTPHALRDLEEENPRSPQPVHAILVTRHDGGRGGAIQQHPPGPGDAHLQGGFGQQQVQVSAEATH